MLRTGASSLDTEAQWSDVAPCYARAPVGHSVGRRTRGLPPHPRRCGSAWAIAWIGPIDKGAPTVGHVEERDPRLLAHTTGVYGVLLVVGSFDKDLASGVRMGAALSATDWLAVQGDLANLQGDDR